jgi:adenylate cyclase
MNKNTKKISLHISSIIILILTISFTIILSFNFYKSSNNSFEYLYKLTDQFSSKTTLKVQSYLTNTNTYLKVIAKINERDIFKNESLNITLMHEYLKENSYISSLYIANNNGDFLQVRNYPKLAIRKVTNKHNRFKDTWEYKDKNFKTKKTEIMYNNYDARKRIWYKNVKKDNIFISTPYKFYSTKELGITISYAVYNEFNEKQFVVAADIDLKSLNSFLKENAKILDAQIALVSSTHTIISDTAMTNSKFITKSIYDKEISSLTIKAAIKYLSDKKDNNIIQNNNETYIFTGNDFKVDSNSNWHLIILIPEDKILGNVKKALYETMAISFLILIVFIIISIKIANSISKPIKELSLNIENLKDLDLTTNIDNNSSIREINDAQNSLISLKNGLSYFSKYMPSDLVKILIKNNEQATIGGIQKDLAIMFTDIEGFTTISESLKPEDLTAQLAIYFELINNVITKHNGTIDKYIGDAVMAFWGAPIHIENPIEKSILAAIEIQKELEILNTKWKKENKPQLKTRIGVHYGQAVVGNIGSLQRMNYTIIGDSVNIAARLEGINKNYNTNIMVSQEVQTIIKDNFKTEFIDSIKLKGKNQVTNIYTIKY